MEVKMKHMELTEREAYLIRQRCHDVCVLGWGGGAALHVHWQQIRYRWVRLCSAFGSTPLRHQTISSFIPLQRCTLNFSSQDDRVRVTKPWPIYVRLSLIMHVVHGTVSSTSHCLLFNFHLRLKQQKAREERWWRGVDERGGTTK